MLLCLGGAPAVAQAKVYYSRSEALELAFRGSDRVEDRTIILDEKQARAVEALAKARLESKLVTLYTAWKDGEVIGYGFIDVHTVRTLPEALLVVLSPEGTVRSLRMLAFYEPEEYRPTERWLALLQRKSRSEGLRGEIHGIAGSTLSARAVTGSVRRALALYAVLVGNERNGDR